MRNFDLLKPREIYSDFQKIQAELCSGNWKKKKPAKYKVYKIPYSHEICFIVEARRGEGTQQQTKANEDNTVNGNKTTLTQGVVSK